MEELGPVFHLLPVLDATSIDLNDWSGFAGGIVTHLPSHSMFEVVPPDESDDDAPFVFRVRLVHVCAGCWHPTPDAQQELAQDALTFWAWDSGLLWQQLPGRVAGYIGWTAQ